MTRKQKAAAEQWERDLKEHSHRLYSEYQRKLKAGEEVSAVHEQLVDVIGDVYGPRVAEYFDRKRALPYVNKSWLPWPISPISFQTIYAVRILVSLAIGGGLFYLTREIGLVSLLIGAIGGAVVFFAVFPLLGMLPFIAPKDLEQRENAVREYEDLVQAHESMAEEAARRAREERLEGER